ncbi:MAG TPA: hypothetical protein VJM31_14480 [Vicinamibacterales bacterium]|nr:hypothetical protein [Vicinamibacterales bacterium]
MLTATRNALVDRTLKWAVDLQQWELTWRTGIYPGEMAAFLGLCDATGAAAIVESGRGLDAYSTHVLGRYAAKTGTRVVSIDQELDPVRGAECRRALSQYSDVECVVGDAFDVFASSVALLPPPVAILLDGPKAFLANRLSLVASCMFSVVAVAHHNSDPGVPWTDQFVRLFPGAYHYESLALEEQEEWRRFKQWEAEAVDGYEVEGTPGRSLSRSSLVLTSVPHGRQSASQLGALGGWGSTLTARRLMARWNRDRARVMRGDSR